MLKKLDSFLAGRKFSAGNTPTFIDFPLFELIEMVKDFDHDTFDSLNNLKAYFTNFVDLVAIKVFEIFIFIKLFI